LFIAACVDDDFTDISVNDSTRWTPDISVPVGEGDVKVAHYFEDYESPVSYPVDSFLVYFEDSLYYLPDQQITDTFHLNFTMDQFSENKDNILYLSLRLVIRNGYPTQVGTQVFLYGGSQLLDSLFSEELIVKPGKVNKQEQVVEPSYKKIDVECDSTTIDNLYKADRAIVYGSVSVTNENLEKVKFYEDYEVNIQMGVQAKLKVNPSEFE
jgi:hypothetical protein